MPELPAPSSTERSRRWASTMGGFADGLPGGPEGVRLAHADSRTSWVEARSHPGPADTPPQGVDPTPRIDPTRRIDPTVSVDPTDRGFSRLGREDAEHRHLLAGATLAEGAGHRLRPEEPDPWRTCFERDRDRILHATAFRRLAGKTQVFVFPDDHQRTRLTHALEVAQVATSVARACRLNVALTDAIALGHDCGHGPGGHASEDALDPYVDGGFDHAPWGADVSLQPLNLCAETLDGIRNHSWSRPAPATPEGEVVSWADRIAYVCHDWEDAVLTGIVSPQMLPDLVRKRCGERRGRQLDAFIEALVTTTLSTGTVGMYEEMAEALAAFRAHNYEHIYLREASVAQGAAVVRVLRALVEHYADRPNDIPAVRDAGGLAPGEPAALRSAVTYVAGMTDRFAFDQARDVLGWDPDELPAGVVG